MNIATQSDCDLFSPPQRREKDLQHNHTAYPAQGIRELTMYLNARETTMAAGARISELSLLDFLE
jgi:hypothetical protein